MITQIKSKNKQEKQFIIKTLIIIILLIALIVLLFFAFKDNKIQSDLIFNTLDGEQMSPVRIDTDYFLPDPIREGYIFEGWFLDETYSNEPVTLIKPTGKEVIVYAKWIATAYTLSFITDGGSSINPISLFYGDEIVLPDNPTKPGYNFGSWFNDINLTTSFTLTQMPAFDITLYAKWNINSYTLEFDTNEGTVIAPISFEYDEDIILPADPEKTGYIFGGWFNEDGLMTPFVLSKMLAQNVTIYAKWNINSYTLAFDTDEGTVIAPISFEYDENIILPADPEKTGYTFGGWFNEEGLTTPFALTKMPANNITVFAKWNINSYSLIFVTNSETVIAPVPFNYNEDIILPEEDPTKTGHSFDGWFEDDLITPFSLAKMPANITYVYAKWTANTYILSFDTDGGTIIDPIDLDYGESIPFILDNPTKTGYNFEGWFESDLVTSFALLEMPDEDVTMYAVWSLMNEGLLFEIIDEWLPEDEHEYKVSIGSCQDLNIVIPAVYNGKPVTMIASNGFIGEGESGGLIIDSIILSDSITLIGSFAFANASLSSISFGSGLIYIDVGAFIGCTNLTSITLNKGLMFIEDSAFSESGLTEITIPSSVIYLGYSNPFDACPLQAIYVEEENTEYISIDGVLYNIDLDILVAYPIANGLTEFEIPDTVAVILDLAFAYTSLNTLYIPESVESIGWFSLHSDFLMTIVISNQNVINIWNTTFNYMLIQNIYVPSASVDAYKAAWSAYFLNDKILAMPQLSFISDGNEIDRFDVIYNMTALRPEDPELEGGDFLGWYLDLSDVDEFDFSTLITEDITLYAKWEFGFSQGLFFEIIDDTLPEIEQEYQVSGGTCEDTVIIVPAIYNGKPVTKIAYDAFYNFTNVVEIIIPDSVTIIDECAFMQCYSLTNIVLPDSITHIYYGAFYLCISLTQIIIPDSVIFLDEWAFALCYSLENVVLSKNITNLYRCTFIVCSSLTSIILPEGLEYIGLNAFDETALISIRIPASVTEIESYAFYRLDTLETVVIEGDFIQAGATIFHRDFNVFPDNLTIYVPRDSVALYQTSMNWIEYASIIVGMPIVTFETDGGEEVATVEVIYGDKLPIPVEPIWIGYDFDGWYTDDTYTTEFDFDTIITSDITLFAKWLVS